MSIAWLPWSLAAFERARAERKPVLLSLQAPWCPTCHEMDRTTYADPAVISLVNDRFVAVRVDADERPDVSDRYSLGGLPTTAFLTADGRVLGGGTFVPAERMRHVLAQVASLAGGLRESGSGVRDPQLAPRRSIPANITHGLEVPGTSGSGPARLEHAIFEAADTEHGGFGAAPKFPLVAPVQLALDIWTESQDLQAESIVIRSLDAMGWGGLYDEVEGGFFQYADTHDWRVPHTAKILGVNADLLRVYLEAGWRLGLGRFTERAAAVLGYVQARLADHEHGGWFAFQAADAAYYSAAQPVRRSLRPPPVAAALCADSNARMVSAALHAARVFQDEGLQAFAVMSLERVTLAGYRPGRGVAHCVDGDARTRGLLGDQVAMIGAHLDAFAATENVVYAMMAEELGRFVIRTMWDDLGGGCFDHAVDELDDEPRGSLVRQRVKPFVANCEAARAFTRLADVSGDPEFARRAEQCLTVMGHVALDHGPLAAHYVLALRQATLR